MTFVTLTDFFSYSFDTGVGGLVLSDQFLQLSTRLPSENVFGLGENVHDSFKHQFGKSWPAFARDQPPFVSDEDLDYVEFCNYFVNGTSTIKSVIFF